MQGSSLNYDYSNDSCTPGNQLDPWEVGFEQVAPIHLVSYGKILPDQQVKKIKSKVFNVAFLINKT